MIICKDATRLNIIKQSVKNKGDPFPQYSFRISILYVKANLLAL